MSSQTFVASCLAGNALLEDVDDWIDRWHDSYTDDSLNAFLGFSQDEGALFVERPNSLRFIIAARYQHRPVTEVLRHPDDLGLAARAGDAGQAAEVLKWLRSAGRLSG